MSSPCHGDKSKVLASWGVKWDTPCHHLLQGEQASFLQEPQKQRLLLSHQGNPLSCLCSTSRSRCLAHLHQPKGTILCHRRGHKRGSLVTNRKHDAAGGDLSPPSPDQDFSALPTSGGGSPTRIPLQHPQGMPCLSLAGCTHPSHPDGSHHCTGSSPGTQGPRDRRVPAAG